MIKNLLLLVIILSGLLSCEQAPPCDLTSGTMHAQVNWDQIPNYSTRSCKIAPADNPKSPLHAEANGVDANAGLVYVSIDIISDCNSSGSWYNNYYWSKVAGYFDNIAVVTNRNFRLGVRYEESCMLDCDKNVYNSAVFKSEMLIKPGVNWDPSPSAIEVLDTPVYIGQNEPCNQ